MDTVRWILIVELFVFIGLGARLWGRDIATISRAAFWNGLINGAGYMLFAVAVFINTFSDMQVTPGTSVAAIGLGALVLGQVAILWLCRVPQTDHTPGA